MEVFEWLERFFIKPFIYFSGPNRDVYESLLCGALAGCAAKTVIAPAERIKMNFQVSRDKFTLGYAWAKGRHVVATQGFFALWRGHSTTIMRIVPYSGFSFAFHDGSENMFKKMLHRDVLPPGYKFLAGSIGGVCGTVLTYPLDVLRVRLAIGRSWAESIRQGGFYQGLAPTLTGIIPYAGTAWLTKQTMHEYFPKIMKRKQTVTESVIINAIAGLFGQFITYPLDVVRRRMQVALANGEGRIPTAREVWTELVRHEGRKGVTKGFSLNMIKGPIAFSVSLTTYDLLRGALHRIDAGEHSVGAGASGDIGASGGIGASGVVGTGREKAKDREGGGDSERAAVIARNIAAAAGNDEGTAAAPTSPSVKQ